MAAAQVVCPCAAWRLVRDIQPKSTVWHPGNDHLADTLTYGDADSLTEAGHGAFLAGTRNSSSYLRRVLITITRRCHTRRMNWTNFIIGSI